MPLHPRHHIDIDLADLSRGLSACVRGLDADRCAHDLEQLVEPRGEVIATLSVRSGFDLFLAAIELPKGSEILLSALTIPDMARLIRAHGYVPVPVDVDPATLSPSYSSLERAWSRQSRVLVVAQLFGGRANMEPATRFAQERGLLLVDDNAQGFTGPSSLGESNADVVFHSFGSIKTSTCLGGGIARIRDAKLRTRMREIHASWPRQSSSTYAKKLALYTSLLVPRDPAIYAVFADLCESHGPGLNEVVMGMTRGFPADDLDGFLASLRRRPCGALTSLLAHRIRSFDRRRVVQRAFAGEALLEAIRGEIDVLGRDVVDRTHWLMAVLVDNPASYIAPLRAMGFDAARGSTSIVAIATPDERPEVVPLQSMRVMERILFVPVYPEIPILDRINLADCLKNLHHAALAQNIQ